MSYEDPQGVWPKLQIIFARLLPFTNVTWKNPVTTNNVTIESLPLRFLPSSARLFDDTDHSFRWFLAPYVSLYILSCDSLERYKTYRPAMRKFVDSVNATRRLVLI